MTYQIKNLRARRTTVALVGIGLHLAPAGSRDDFAFILDSEVEEDDVQAKHTAGIISLTKLEAPVTVERSEDVLRLRARLASRKLADKRNAERKFLYITQPAAPVTPSLSTTSDSMLTTTPDMTPATEE